MIYLDNAATTKPLPLFLSSATEYLQSGWYNPSAVYKEAVDVKRSLEKTRALAEAAMGGSYQCIFTSCGTESAYLAIRGSLGKDVLGKHILSTKAEHPCVYENMQQLIKLGADVEFVDVDRHGRVVKTDFLSKLRPDTALVSIMHVSNITGAVNDISGLYHITKDKAPGAVFHADGVQGFLKVAPPVCDLYTGSAHKVHALKGTGMLFIKNDFSFAGKLPGGGQEENIRSGTENTLGILSLQCSLAQWDETHNAHMMQCKDTMRKLLTEKLEEIRFHTPLESAPHILNLSIKGVGGEIMLHSLEAKGILISTGSACASRRRDDRISQALGLTKEQGETQIRLSFSYDTPLDELEFVADQIVAIAKRHRKLMRSK